MKSSSYVENLKGKEEVIENFEVNENFEVEDLKVYESMNMIEKFDEIYVYM